jgi:hypothetical protein
MQRTNFFIIIILLAYMGVAANTNKGKTGLSFLKIGIDARAIGMGEAYTALANDASATYWNPAGMLGTQRSSVILNHNEWIQDIRGEFAAISFVGEKSAWGLHLRSFYIGGIEIRDIPTEEPLDESSAYYLSTGISYAHRLHSRIDIGLSIKYLYEKIFVATASGFAIDLGLIYRVPFPNIQLGFSILNLGKMNNLQNEASILPQVNRFGLAYNIPLKSEATDWLWSADLVKPSQENVRLHIGTEVLLWSQLAIRGGYYVGYEARDFSAGLGFLRSSIRLDYGLTPFDDGLGTTHRFTIAFNI